jgi:O-antigen ligase
LNQISEFLKDRIQVNSLLVIACFVSVLALSSQSAASYSTYMLALAMLFSYRHWNDVLHVRMMWLVGALLLYLATSGFWSEGADARAIVSIFIRALLVFFFVVAFAECQLRGLFQRWLGRTVAIAGGIAAVFAIAAYAIKQPTDGRLVGLGQLDNPVIVALILGVVLIFVLEILIRESSNRWRLPALLSAIFIVAVVYLSDSRNAWGSVLIGSLVFVFAHRIQDRQKFIATLAALAVLLVVVLAALYANDTTREIVMPRGDSFRPRIWAAIFSDVWTNGIVFGRGILTSDAVAIGKLIWPHPHNMYLAVLFQGGLVGAFLFFTLLGITLKTLFANYERDDAKLAMGILGVALPSYLLDGHELVDKVGETWFLFWLPVAISVGLSWSRTPRLH